MKEQKRNDSVSLKLTLEHSDARSLSSSLVTEADFVSKDGEISVSLHSESFNDSRARCTRPSTEDIQALARELQALRGQIQSISSQCSEYGITIESLSEQDPSKPVYRSLGNILLEVDDRDSLLEELKSAEKALTEHLTRLAEREESIREKYEEMAEQFEME